MTLLITANKKKIYVISHLLMFLSKAIIIVVFIRTVVVSFEFEKGLLLNIKVGPK
jgi:hypothetical protein